MQEETAALTQIFSRHLMEWHPTLERPMPWKGEKDPFKIWLSEIILQQTRVAQGWDYYLKFISAFPTVQHLAKASLDEVLSLWQGLGYYSRARNLHKAAKQIVEKHEGIFPQNYKDIIELPGIGPYTAAAIASFAFGLPHAVVDGNVQRVLSRFFGVSEAIDKPSGQKKIGYLAKACLVDDQAALYNQAIMDFGAVLCTPASPSCDTCPLVGHCTAYINQQVGVLPFKSKKMIKRDRYFHFLVLEEADTFWLEQRGPKDIWEGLYQFPLIEVETIQTDKEILQAQLTWQGIFVEQPIRATKQVLTHQIIHATFWKCKAEKGFSLPSERFIPVKLKNLANFALPKIMDWYFKDRSLRLF